jgi:SPP1 gp7 family putative phage head morphogenesis protein
MDPETQRAIDEILEQLRRDLVAELERAGIEAYVQGDLVGYSSLGIKPDFKTVDPDAVRFAQQYGELLRSEGATIINGRKVPWLQRMSEEQRAEVYRIIEEGIKTGKYPGVKERREGGYDEGTIAADLEQYFDQRRSHASTVARTEVSRIKNTAQLNRWSRYGVKTVRVVDDEGPNSCQACYEANGQVWPLQEALNRLKEHPNCVRTFVVEDEGI